MLNRRAFLAGVGAVAGLAACGSRAALASVATAAPRRRLERIGIQLYTARQQMRADMPATLARIAQIGYKDVEFAGYFGRTPAQVKELLAQNNLRSPSTHLAIELVRSDRTLDEAAEMGHEFVTVPSLPRANTASADTYRATADEFNRIAERARARGLHFAYHNHDAEFRPLDGATPYDLLVNGTDPALVSFQVDVFWMVRAGRDPREFIRANPTRVPMLHIKDSAGPPHHTQVDVGKGTIDFAGILREDASRNHLIRSVYVEHDEPADPLAFAKTSFDYLSKLEF